MKTMAPFLEIPLQRTIIELSTRMGRKYSSTRSEKNSREARASWRGDGRRGRGGRLLCRDRGRGGRRRQKLILGVSLLGKGWARKPLGNPNRLIESSLLSSLYRRLEACPISLFLSTRIAPIRLQNLSHVPLHDRFVNRICQLLVLTPPSFDPGSCTRKMKRKGRLSGRFVKAE